MAARFEGKVVAISGAAGGIGRAAVQRFAREGARVVAVDLPSDVLDAVVSEAKQSGAEAIAVPADVTRPAQVEQYVQAAVARFGGLDVLFNNAGIEGWIGPTLDYPEDIFDKVLAVNVKGVWLGIKYAVPAMRARGGGAIVNTASTAGLGGTPTLFAYGASKHAVVGMTKSAALEFAHDNIRVNAVCPAPIHTRMMYALERGINADDPDSVRQAMLASIPLGRYGQPEEVAALAAFLCSDEAGFITGGIYPIDGGSKAR